MNRLRKTDKSTETPKKAITIQINQRVFYGTLATLGIVALVYVGILMFRSRVTATQPQPQPALSVQQTPVAFPTPLPAVAYSAEAEALFPSLNCLCGSCNNTLAACDCGQARSMKGYVDSLVEAGTAASEVIDKVLEQYGSQALAGEEQVAKSQPPPGTSQPDINLSADFYDFGTMMASDAVSHVFTVENNGDAQLLIKDVKSLCACTEATISAKEIPPGGKTELTVTFTPAVHKILGKVSRTVIIESNDPDEPKKELIITAEVKE